MGNDEDDVRERMERDMRDARLAAQGDVREIREREKAFAALEDDLAKALDLKAPRAKEMRPLSAALSEIAEAFAASPLSKWTDEQWAEHDRRVRAEAEQARLNEALRAETKRRAAIAEWGVPQKDLERAARGTAERSEAVQALAEFDRDPRLAVLVLSGAPWSGKTTAAGVWLAASRRADRGARASDPIFARASKLSTASRYDEEQVARWETAARMVLDDLGAEYADAKGSWASALDSLIDARYAAELPLVITTNLSIDDFKTRYGERIVRRIREKGRFVVVRGDFADRRPR